MQTLRSKKCTSKARMGVLAILLMMSRLPAHAQSRGVYPLGMSSTNSGITPASGFTYSNQLLFYYRNESKDEQGVTKPVTGSSAVLMDMNSIIWVSKRTLLGGAHYSRDCDAALFAKNDLTSDINGNISGGGGFADSYYVCHSSSDGIRNASLAVRLLYGFLAPTRGVTPPTLSNNVGSGYWTNAISSGQTFSLTRNKTWAVSTFEMYEFHTPQEGTQTHPGQTFESRLFAGFQGNPHLPKVCWLVRLQVRVTGYEARQTTAPFRRRHHTHPRRRPLCH